MHIIFVRGLGQIRRTHVWGFYLFAISVFLTIFIVISIFIINDYADLRRENQDLRRKNSKLARLVKKYKIQSQLDRQYPLLARELSRAEQTDRPALNTKADGSSEDRSVSESAAVTAQSEDSKKAGKGTPAAKKPPVSVAKLTLTADKTRRTLGFSFSLKKISTETDPVSGYMIIVLVNSKADPPILSPFPASVKLTNGEPANYRQGQQFAIRRGKTVRGTIKKISNPEKFDQAIIFSYSPRGELLVKETLQVSNAN